MESAVAISRTLLDALIAEAAASPDAECCGLLFGTRGRIIDAVSCRNVAADPARRFEIDPAALIAAHRAARDGGPTIIGHYHSHPGGTARPSVEDAAQSAADGAYWLIIARDQATLWRAVASGREAGRFDPVTLESD